MICDWGQCGEDTASMGFFDRLTNIFSSSGRGESALLKGVEHAKAGRPQEAVKVYDALLQDAETAAITRARALFNRALAHSALKNDSQAIADLKAVLALPNLPENVQSAARTQLARVSKRQE